MKNLTIALLAVFAFAANASDTGNYRDAQNDAHPVFHYDNHVAGAPTTAMPSISRGSK
ncbi:hypothetical protein VIN01S_35220 [Vibrio inusitatus NBRC 102082]|uniref:Uncharacterized protein n=1 Tax=Vibrio inusitatus NBRC 102082 TaxID=1219070 RepID=A0A4Y3I0F5_9VIBR|nr:hypothetical protein [Vibrio inusitatus]GEA52718.1 hypothetical protein VIN01S_35220 [Vibrio inusitatus NBRC 102082]